MTRSWILVGMMGAGKSSLGRELAERAEREFVDTDILIQARLGRGIPQFFRLYGEEAFREHETGVLRGLQPGPYVLATGGGIVLREDNWKILRDLGPIVYLQAEVPTLVDRLERSKKKRPLLDVEDWETRLTTLLEARRPLYEQADATFCVDSQEIAEAAIRLQALFEELERQ